MEGAVWVGVGGHVWDRCSWGPDGSRTFYFDVASNETKEIIVTLVGDAMFRMKYETPPSMFSYDVTSSLIPQMDGKIVSRVKLTTCTRPYLRTGRWFFSVSPMKFLAADVTFEVYIAEEALDLSCRQSVEDFEAGSYVVVSVYENQRRKTPFSEFSAASLYPNESAWTDKFGEATLSRENIQLPDFNWCWIGQWKVDLIANKTDNEGWSYSYALENPLKSEWSMWPTPFSFVRRRCWVRFRRILTVEEKEKIIAKPQETCNVDDIIEGFEMVQVEEPSHSLTNSPTPTASSSATSPGLMDNISMIFAFDKPKVFLDDDSTEHIHPPPPYRNSLPPQRSSKNDHLHSPVISRESVAESFNVKDGKEEEKEENEEGKEEGKGKENEEEEYVPSYSSIPTEDFHEIGFSPTREKPAEPVETVEEMEARIRAEVEASLSSLEEKARMKVKPQQSEIDVQKQKESELFRKQMEEKALKAKELQEKMASLLSRANAQSSDQIVKSENFHVITPSTPPQQPQPQDSSPDLPKE